MDKAVGTFTELQELNHNIRCPLLVIFSIDKDKAFGEIQYKCMIIFGDDGYVYYLDCSFTCVCIHSDSSNCVWVYLGGISG